MTVNPIMVNQGLNLISDTITALKEYKIASQKEETERERIRATLKTYLHLIDANHEATCLKLNTKHVETMKLFEMMEVCLIEAVKRSEPEMVKTLGQILLSQQDNCLIHGNAKLPELFLKE